MPPFSEKRFVRYLKQSELLRVQANGDSNKGPAPCIGRQPSAKLTVFTAPPVVALHDLLPAIRFLLAFQTQANPRQRATPSFGNGFAAGFAEHQALASGQTGPRPSDFIINGILNLILNRGIS